MNEIKISAGGKTYRLTDRNNGEKYTRAVAAAGEGATNEQILAHYDKLAGNIKDKDHQPVANGPFWAEEKMHMENEKRDLKNKSDGELEDIIRRGENMHVPGSLFQLAKIELELRDRKNKHSHMNGVFFEVAGDMRNDGVIQTGKEAVVGVKVGGNYTSKKGTILQGIQEKSRRPELVIGIISVIIALVSIQWWPAWFAYFTRQSSAQDDVQTTATSTLMLSDILARYSSFDTNLERRNFLEKYRDVSVYGRGSYENIDKPGDRFLVTIQVSDNLVSCLFNGDLETEQKLSLLKPGQNISFTGTFTTGAVFGGGWTVEDCMLVK